MNNSFKIRLLLLFLTLSLFATAITIRITFHKEEILKIDANKLQNKLHQKELYVKNYLDNTSNFNALKNIELDEDLSSKLIPEFRDRLLLFLYTYKNHKLSFWGASRIAPETDAKLKEGFNFIPTENGWYQAYKRSSGNFSAIIFIPVKSNFPFENKYLRNIFAPDLITTNNLDISSLKDSDDYSIVDITGKYSFSVKLKSAIQNSYYSSVEVYLWALALLSACVFMNFVCKWIAAKGYTKFAILFFGLFLLLIRLISLKFNWVGTHYNLPAFDTKYYTDNFFLPNIGSLLLNVMAMLWVLIFAYSYRKEIHIQPRNSNKFINYTLFVSLGLFVCLIAFVTNNVFYNFIIKSTINFDISNILSLTKFSWIGLFILCVSILNLYIIIEIALCVSYSIELPNKEKLVIFIAGISLLLLYKLTIADYSVYFLLLALIIFIRGLNVYNHQTGFVLGNFVIIILAFAIITSGKLTGFQFVKEKESRKIIARELDSSDDPNAVLLFFDLEQEILKDNFIINYFKSSAKDYSALNNKLRKFYFDGHLSRYDFKTFEFKADGAAINSDNSSAINYYKDLVISGSIKVSDYFYRINNTFGSQNYFALLPVTDNGKNLGTLIIELNSKNFENAADFPQVLLDGKVDNNNQLRNYSFAFYANGHLVNQYGRYIYNLVNYDLPGNQDKFVFIEKNGYNHLIYQPNSKKLIVVSKPLMTGVMQLASVSFLFLALLSFAVLVITVNWFWISFKNNNMRFRKLLLNVFLSTNKILYKTRIQASMVAGVILTLVLIGFITYISISYQYREQQQELILDRINKIAEGFENQIFNNGELKINNQMFDDFADVNAADLSYFSINGKLMFTTQPKIYDYDLLAPRINELAYIYLNNYQRSEYFSTEKIGDMSYISVYRPIRNNKHETIAYLSLPYFSNEQEFEERIGQFLNTLINVYALIFVGIGFFAVFAANQITYPLTLVQKSLSETKIGQKNEPIIWKREDEIGNLIKEYNNMIIALEQSTQKLARSERETAWKEMAKQVAHEIKNPLTPLKLGVQLLEKSWKEKDPKFDQKFEKFSKSFIEQIESLSHIASEFSNFAKMPETALDNVRIREILEQSIEVYNQVSYIKIILNDETKNPIVKGDRDQLLRSFNNLIKNAIEAIPDYEDGLIIISLSQKGGYAHIEIKDNGKGIPEGLRERIFNPNFTTKSSGTGLGLAFVKQAIENMLGTIHFETSTDTGTTFYITVPLA